MSPRVGRFALVLFGIAAIATPAAAQEPPVGGSMAAPPGTEPVPPPPAAEVPPAPPPMTEPLAAPPPPPAPTPPPAAASGAIAPAAAPVKIDSATTTIKFGLLAQSQYQALGSVATDGLTHNLFLRRIRILVGGTLFGMVDYFVETDSPNLFLANNVAGGMATPKNLPAMAIQDALFTYKPMGDMLKIDVGYMLPPMSHNAVQSAASLFGWDYFAYTFQHSNAFGSSANPVGRDLGVELRGLVVGGHLEYRAGLFQGLRNASTATDVGGRNFFRVVARLQVNLLDAEPGFFYAGTYLGAKKILSIGGSFDFQDKYKYFAGDAILDLPLGPGVLTAQVNVAQWDGGTWIPTLVKQTAIMGEAGYTIAAAQLSPIVRVEHLQGTGLPDQNRYALGVAFWPFGHNSNLKAFYTRIAQDRAAHGANQFNLQWQVFFF